MRKHLRKRMCKCSPASQGPAHLSSVRPGVHPVLLNSPTALPWLHLAAHKARGPGSAAAAVVASLRLKHKAAIAHGQASCQRNCVGWPAAAGPLALLRLALFAARAAMLVSINDI